MSDVKTCLLCGVEDRDVVVGLVEIPDAERRVVSAAVVAAETRRGVSAFDQVDVRERYASMPRCRDKRACAERLRALDGPMEPIAPAAAHDISDDEEGPTWAT